jgi:uncharacterized LabA/DUF88 family protein
MANCKVAILIDGGFFKQRFKANNGNILPSRKDVEVLVSEIMYKLQGKSGSHTTDVLLRSFYYDCLPFAKKIKHINGKEVDYSKGVVYKTQTVYMNSLKTIDQFALRLGEIAFAGWKLNSFKPQSTNPLPDFRQKGVDMKIGLDMAWMAGKKSVEKMVLVTGDSDFIAPIKLVRREGILVYLYPMGATTLKSELKEHADFILD